MTLTEFLLARIAEDEAPAIAFGYASTWTRIKDAARGTGRPWQGSWSPSRVIRECAAKRRILEMASGSEDFVTAMPRPGYAQPYHSPSVDILIRAQQLLALPYADHPDYQPEWRP